MSRWSEFAKPACPPRGCGRASVRAAAPLPPAPEAPARRARPPSPPRAARGSPGRASRRRSEEHTSELQSQSNLVCRLLLEKQKQKYSVMQALTISAPTDILHFV